MKHGKQTHYFYRCFVSCSSCSVGVRQLHTPYHTSREFLGASPLHLSASCGSSQGLPTPGEAQHCKDWNGCLNLHLESSSHPFPGSELLLFPGFMFPVESTDVRGGSVLPLWQGSDSCLGYSTAAAWPKAFSNSSATLARKHLNLRQTCG